MAFGRNNDGPVLLKQCLNVVHSTINIAGEGGDCLGVDANGQDLVEVEFFGQRFGRVRPMLECTEGPPRTTGIGGTKFGNSEEVTGRKING